MTADQGSTRALGLGAQRCMIWTFLALLCLLLSGPASSFLVAPALWRALSRPSRLAKVGQPSANPQQLATPQQQRQQGPGGAQRRSAALTRRRTAAAAAAGARPQPSMSEPSIIRDGPAVIDDPSLLLMPQSSATSLLPGHNEAAVVVTDVAAEAVVSPSSRHLPLWELLRELERRGLSYHMLEERAVLEQRLQDAVVPMPRGRPAVTAALSSVVGAVIRHDDGMQQGEEAEAPSSGMTVEASVSEERRSEEDGAMVVEEEELPSATTGEAVVEKEEGAAIADAGGVFAGVEEAVSWARQLTEEELRFELDFLGLKLTGSQDRMARRLAVALTRGPAAAVAEEKEVKPSRSAAAQSWASWQRPRRRARDEWAEDEDEDEEVVPVVSRRRRRQQQRQQQLEGGQQEGVEKVRRPMLALDDDDAWMLLDEVDEAEDWGVVDGKGGWVVDGGSNGSGKLKKKKKAAKQPEAAAKTTGSSSSRPTSERAEEAGEGQERGAPQQRRRRKSAEEEDEEALDAVMDNVLQATDTAVGWARKAGKAASALWTIMVQEGFVGRRRRRRRGYEDEDDEDEEEMEGERERKMRRPAVTTSSVASVLVSSSVNAVLQGVMAAAAWAGAGVVSSQYVLFTASGVSLIFRRGLGGFGLGLLLVRACCTALRKLMMQDEEEAAQQAARKREARRRRAAVAARAAQGTSDRRTRGIQGNEAKESWLN